MKNRMRFRALIFARLHARFRLALFACNPIPHGTEPAFANADAIKKFALLLIAPLGLCAFVKHLQPVTYPPGVLIDAEPIQHAIATPLAPIERGGFTLTPLAQFEIAARVLHT